MQDFIKSFDYFPKLTDKVEPTKTSFGGLIFLFCTILSASLFIHETYEFILGNPISEPFVDTSNINEKVKVVMNISLFDIPCDAVTVDYQDITGSNMPDVHHTLYKLELNNAGIIVDRNRMESVRTAERSALHPSHPLIDWSGSSNDALGEDSCYGAELFAGQKCKTCEQVMAAYAARNWPGILLY